MTPVERVLYLQGVDLLKDVGPRHLLALAEVAREVDIWAGDTIFHEEDPADALYIVVDGRVRLSVNGRTISEVARGEAFGSWSLVDDSARLQRAECIENGTALALDREEFYEVASADLTVLQQVVRVLAKRLRALVAEQPEQARVEGEGVEKPEAVQEIEDKTQAAAAGEPPAPTTPPGLVSQGAALEGAALGKPKAEGEAPPPETPISTAEPTGPPGKAAER
jgi:CRP-like cAMP-binding protein